MRGTDTWTTDRLVLTNSVVLQALGAGQSLRGVKHLDQRPDLCLIDDLEDEESVRSPEARAAMMRWLFGALIPALTPDAKIRFIGNRLDTQAVIAQVARDPEWLALRFPIMTPNVETGADVPTWPDMFPLDWIYKKRDKLLRTVSPTPGARSICARPTRRRPASSPRALPGHRPAARADLGGDLDDGRPGALGQ